VFVRVSVGVVIGQLFGSANAAERTYPVGQCIVLVRQEERAYKCVLRLLATRAHTH